MRKGYNTTVVEYEGRGHENFSDEILRIFDWMGSFAAELRPQGVRRRDDASLGQFSSGGSSCGNCRPKSTVAPDHFPPPRGTLAMRTEARVTPNQRDLRAHRGPAQATVWLSPDVLDLSRRRVTVKINGKEISPGSAALAGDVAVILEDARTRGDRQHPVLVQSGILHRPRGERISSKKLWRGRLGCTEDASVGRHARAQTRVPCPRSNSGCHATAVNARTVRAVAKELEFQHFEPPVRIMVFAETLVARRLEDADNILRRAGNSLRLFRTGGRHREIGHPPGG